MKRRLIIILVTGLLLFILLPYVIFILATKYTVSLDSLRLFISDWGGFIGILATLFVAVLVSLIPSQVETQVKHIAERLQSTLEGFDAVYSKALELLTIIKDNPNSTFMMISATPVFGIELSDDDRNRWTTILRQRIVSSYTTRIVCLDWGTRGECAQSPLHLFCDTLAKSYLRDPKKASELFCRAREDTIDFWRLASQYANSIIQLGSDPPLQVIISKDGSGKSRGIIYFASSKTLHQSISVTGFYSEDQRWTKVMEEIFDYVEHEALADFQDERTPQQIERDIALLSYRNQHQQGYETDINGIKLTVLPEVFPPNFGLTTLLLKNAIDEIAVSQFLEVPFEKRVGIDIGTGTGLLALALAKHCSIVYATDNHEEAVRNAELNVEKMQMGESVKIFHGDLFADIPPLIEGSIPLIVFNHPYYPSPFNLYNNGAYDAGNPIILRFLQQASGLIGKGGAIVMPYSTVAGHHNPLTIANDLKLHGQTVVSQDSEPGGKDYVFMFTKYSRKE